MKNFFKDLAEKFVIISSDHEERARKLKEEKCLKLVGLENREEENIERYLKSPSGVNSEVSDFVLEEEERVLRMPLSVSDGAKSIKKASVISGKDSKGKTWKEVEVSPLATGAYEYQKDPKTGKVKTKPHLSALKVAVYVPLRYGETGLIIDESYKSFIMALNHSLKNHFAEMEYLHNYKKTGNEELPRRYIDMPKEWQARIDENMKEVIKKFDAIKFTFADDGIPSFAEAESKSNRHCAVYTASLYKVANKSDLSKLKNIVKAEKKKLTKEAEAEREMQ